MHELHQLTALITTHRVEHALHLRLFLLQLLDELVQGFDAREELAPLVHEAGKVRLAPAGLLVQHLVEIAQHVLHGAQVLGRHVLKGLLHALELLLHDLPPQLLHKLLEHLPRVGIHEVVVLEPLDLTGHVIGQLV